METKLSCFFEILLSQSSTFPLSECYENILFENVWYLKLALHLSMYNYAFFTMFFVYPLFLAIGMLAEPKIEFLENLQSTFSNNYKKFIKPLFNNLIFGILLYTAYVIVCAFFVLFPIILFGIFFSWWTILILILWLFYFVGVATLYWYTLKILNLAIAKTLKVSSVLINIFLLFYLMYEVNYFGILSYF